MGVSLSRNSINDNEFHVAVGFFMV